MCLNGTDSALVTHLSHPEGDFIDLVDGHKCLHIVKEEHIVEDGGKQGQRAVEHCSGEDALPEGQDAPAHSSVSVTLLRLFSVPSCNHLTAWRSGGGHHLMVGYKNQADESRETREKYSECYFQTEEGKRPLPPPTVPRNYCKMIKWY